MTSSSNLILKFNLPTLIILYTMLVYVLLWYSQYHQKHHHHHQHYHYHHHYKPPQRNAHLVLEVILSSLHICQQASIKY